MALLSALGGAVLAHILAPENFGRLADLVVPVYTILAIAILVSFSKNVESRSEKKEQNYVLKKSGAEEALTWKQKFIGNWEKTERPGFKEFAIFMGQSSFIAGIAEGKPFGNIISFQDSTEKSIKIETTGIPQQPCEWMELGGPGVPNKDGRGQAIIDKAWFDEGEQKLYRVFQSVEGIADPYEVTQTREMAPDGKLIANVTMVKKKDNSSASFKTVFKRI